MFALNTFDGEEALQGEEARHLWNRIIKKASEVEDPRLPQSGAAQYLSTNQMVRHRLLNGAGRLMYGIRRAEL